MKTNINNRGRGYKVGGKVVGKVVGTAGSVWVAYSEADYRPMCRAFDRMYRGK